MERQSFEDVSRVKNGDLSIDMLVFREGIWSNYSDLTNRPHLKVGIE